MILRLANQPVVDLIRWLYGVKLKFHQNRTKDQSRCLIRQNRLWKSYKLRRNHLQNVSNLDQLLHPVAHKINLTQFVCKVQHKSRSKKIQKLRYVLLEIQQKCILLNQKSVRKSQFKEANQESKSQKTSFQCKNRKSTIYPSKYIRQGRRPWKEKRTARHFEANWMRRLASFNLKEKYASNQKPLVIKISRMLKIFGGISYSLKLRLGNKKL